MNANLNSNKFLQAVALDLAAAKISNPTIQQISDAMRDRLARDWKLGIWLTGNTEAAGEARTILAAAAWGAARL